MNKTNQNQIVQPYLFFGGRCEEALDFYRRALGAELDMIMRFKDCPDPNGCPADWTNKVMHSSFHIGDTTVMASDGCWEERQTGFKGFSLSLTVTDEAEAYRRFSALSEGGEVRMPLETTFFAKRFGMVADRFGVTWMVLVPAEMRAGAGQKVEAAMA